MIKLYAFYSIGGYKDLYLGEIKADCSPTYFLPLLSIMKKRNKEEELEKVAELEALPRIERITTSNRCGFPQDCSTFFSHGGYILLYKTLNDGRSCLALRDITSSTRDEEGRGTPFNLLFTADSETDIKMLDNAAVFCLQNITLINDIFSPTIVYDGKVNGTRADLPLIYEWITSCPATQPLSHEMGKYNFVMVSNPETIKVFLNEHSVTTKCIDAFCTADGIIIKGAIHYIQPQDTQQSSERDCQNVDITNIDGQNNELEKFEENADDTELSPKTDMSEEKKDIPDEQDDITEVKQQDADSFRGDYNTNQEGNIERGRGYEERNQEKHNRLSVRVKQHVDEDNGLYTDIFGIPVLTRYISWIILGTFIVGFILGRITITQ